MDGSNKRDLNFQKKKKRYFTFSVCTDIDEGGMASFIKDETLFIITTIYVELDEVESMIEGDLSSNQVTKRSSFMTQPDDHQSQSSCCGKKRQ